MDIAVITEKLNGLPSFTSGSHSGIEQGVCAMEAAAYIAGEPWSDRPQCVSPVIAAFLRSWNDTLPDLDRDRLLRPLIPVVIGTRTGQGDDYRRSWMATDWLVREFLPAFLRLAKIDDHADACASLPEISSAIEWDNAESTINAAGAAAGAAARVAAWGAAWDAAWDAAWAAARAAARAALAPTVTAVQESAARLVVRMAEVGSRSPADTPPVG